MAVDPDKEVDPVTDIPVVVILPESRLPVRFIDPVIDRF
jgi:hypothetical protein